MTNERPYPPRFRGVTTYRDPMGRFAFRYPSDWNSFELADDREGTLFSPEDEPPATYFAAWIGKLDEHVVAEDMETLREGIEEGLAQLPEYSNEESHDDTYGNLVKFERIYTFRDGDTIRKRRVWMMYIDVWQLVLVFQGANPDEYKYWLPMGNYSFSTFELPQELWFATDRDLQAFREPSND